MMRKMTTIQWMRTIAADKKFLSQILKGLRKGAMIIKAAITKKQTALVPHLSLVTEDKLSPLNSPKI